MAEKFKWDVKNVQKLINYKHSDEMQTKLEEANNNPAKLENAQEEIASEVGSNVSLKECKEKYNSLLTKYKRELDTSSRSGASPSLWKYWNTFHTSFPKKIKLSAENVEELGSGEESITNLSTPVEFDCDASRPT